MSHEVETAMFVGQPAWHGLGTVLESAPSIEEAIVAAGLDWKVLTANLVTEERFQDPNSAHVDHLPIPAARVTIRESDLSVLGIVGTEFVPLQNVDAFKFFQPFLDNGTASLEAAGSLRMGKRVWVLASIDQKAEIVPGDEIRNYVLLAHGHDGSLAIRVGFTTVRVVCANTLATSMQEGNSKLVKIHHRKHAADALELVQSAMQLASQDFVANAETFRLLAKRDCTEDLLKSYVREVLHPGNAADEDASKITVSKVLRLFEEGRGSDLPGVRGTLWGAYNAVTEFLTHERGKTADARVESSWFGDAAVLTERALMLAIEAAAGRFTTDGLVEP